MRVLRTQKRISKMGEISKYSWVTLIIFVAINYFKTIVIDPKLSAHSCAYFDKSSHLAGYYNKTVVHHPDPGPVHHSEQAASTDDGHGIHSSLTTMHTNQCVEYTLLYAFVLGILLTVFSSSVFIAASEYFDKLLLLTMASEGIDVESESM